jgi:hypothetical protein
MTRGGRRRPCDVPREGDPLATDLPLFPMPGPLLRLSATGGGGRALWSQNNGSLMIHCEGRRGLSMPAFLRSLPRSPIKSEGGHLVRASSTSPTYTHTSPPPHSRNGSVKCSQVLRPPRHPPLHEQQRRRALPAPRNAIQISATDPVILHPVHRGHSCSHAAPEATVVHPQHHPFPGTHTAHRFGKPSASAAV